MKRVKVPDIVEVIKSRVEQRFSIRLVVDYMWIGPFISEASKIWVFKVRETNLVKIPNFVLERIKSDSDLELIVDYICSEIGRAKLLDAIVEGRTVIDSDCIRVPDRFLGKDSFYEKIEEFDEHI